MEFCSSFFLKLLEKILNVTCLSLRNEGDENHKKGDHQGAVEASERENSERTLPCCHYSQPAHHTVNTQLARKLFISCESNSRTSRPWSGSE